MGILYVFFFSFIGLESNSILPDGKFEPNSRVVTILMTNSGNATIQHDVPHVAIMCPFYLSQEKSLKSIFFRNF